VLGRRQVLVRVRVRGRGRGRGRGRVRVRVRVMRRLRRCSAGGRSYFVTRLLTTT